MYGTIARLKVKPELIEQFIAFGQESSVSSIPGWVASYVYRLDAAADEFLLAVVFESREAYLANASSPSQDESYRKMRALLAADPEWNDGDVVFAAHNPLQAGA